MSRAGQPALPLNRAWDTPHLKTFDGVQRLTRSNSWVDWLVPFLVLAYLTMSRTFAHVGVGPLYVGEIALGAILLFAPRALLFPFLQSALRRGPLSAMALCLLVSTAFGAVQCLRGILTGYETLDALKNVVFHTYPFFFFVGVWVGVRHPDCLKRLIHGLAWIHGIYGILFLTVFSPLGLTEEIADADAGHVGWFGHPEGAAVALLGLVCFQPQLVRVWLPLLLNAFVLLWMRVRAAWLGFAVGVSLLGCLTGRIRLVTKAAAVIALLLVAGSMIDIRIPGPPGSEQVISSRDIVGRAIAAVDPRLAGRFTEYARTYGDTVSWRKLWWQEISERVHAGPLRAAFGLGYGYPLWELHPLDLDGDKIRTPHNVFMYALGYTGWVGLAVFCVLQLVLWRLLWKAYRLTGQPFGFCYAVMILVWASFDNFFEAPFGAIPFYLLTGLAAAPAVAAAFRPREDNQP